jgi:hypothetical protein
MSLHIVGNNPPFDTKEITKCSNPIQIIQNFHFQNAAWKQKYTENVGNRGNVPLKVGPNATRTVMYLIHPVTSIAYFVTGCTTYACHTVTRNQYS